MIHIKIPQDVAFILGKIRNAGYEAYAVGGCVRDSLLKKIPKDWDITTSALPEQIKEIFPRTIDTGIKHGTVTVMINSTGYEVTTYRVDGEYLDGRHPEEVEFTANLDEDLKRRDFTINAFVYNEAEGVKDLFGGLKDLEDGIIRCVGVAEERFGEDALRILRAVRFAAVLSFTIEPETYKAAVKLAGNLSKVSAERIKAELRSFSKGRSGVESLIKNLEEAVKDRQDYGALLERFCARGEEMKVSEDEFDYIYYTYGLEHYDNMPLIEPLEFRDTKKIRDFVIVLDTSASCRGDIIRSFLAKTYNIIHNSESFFQKVNVHILQCDNEVQSDTKIQKQSDFDDFIKNGSFVGFGGTDFRPAFDYIDELVENEEFTDLKGVIYFTDGYGIYPEKAPEYECIFAFLNEDEHRMEVPWWAIPVVISDEQLQEKEQS